MMTYITVCCGNLQEIHVSLSRADIYIFSRDYISKPLQYSEQGRKKGGGGTKK